MNAEKRKAKGIEDDGPYRNQDETIEIALNLNVDPRKPGQSLRGTLSLPHGSGKAVRCVVFTASASAAEEALRAGAVAAGGDDLVTDISDGTLPPMSFDRSLASPEMMSRLSKVARLLGPRGLMPNAKLGTIVPADKLSSAVEEQMTGSVQYRTDKCGTVHAGIGRGSFGLQKLSENIRAFVEGIEEAKPEAYGRPKKGQKKVKASKNAKYVLSAFMTSTQGKGHKLDLDTIDPNSNRFMVDPHEGEGETKAA